MQATPLIAALFTLLIAADCLAENGGRLHELNPKRVAELAKWLPNEPSGCHGKPIADRAYWNSPQLKARLSAVISAAEGFIKTPFPAWEDDAYLEFSRAGIRPKGEAMMRARSERLAPLVLAECIENQGRYLPAIHEALAGYVEQPTWTLPAHDWNLKCFRREAYTVDLGSAIHSADMAQALWLLGDHIDAKLRQRVIAAIQGRVFKPFRASIETGQGHWWLGNEKDPVKNNWNAVCLAGTVYAALTLVPEREERAVFAAAGEHYVRYYLNGLRPSGFCDEGGGYWNYGFGFFCHLRETLIRETSGRVELFDLPRSCESSLFGSRYQMTAGLMPTFADSRNGTCVDEGLLNYCEIAMGRGGEPSKVRLWGNRLSTILAESTPMANRPRAVDSDASDQLRHYFQDVGILVCRPVPGSGSQLGLAVKSGGNSSHSHNDIGSFVISLADQLPMGDPGGPLMYDNKTFTEARFQRKLLNSYGHPVPVIGGTLQKDSTRVRPKVLSTSFANELDEITIDMTTAYAHPAIKSLTRTVQYRRSGRGQVVVRDEFDFSEPTGIELALTTRGSVESLGSNRFRFTAGNARLIAEFRELEAIDPKIEEFTELGVTFRRVGIAGKAKLIKGTIELVIQPDGPPEAE